MVFRRMPIHQAYALNVDSSESAAGPTLASTVTARLRMAIITGNLTPGAKINIDRVRDQLGVSLSPLREALSRLLAEGFLTFQDNRGYRVAPVSDADLRQISRLRIKLETFALREAIELGDQRWEEAVLLRLEELRAIRCDPKDLHSVEQYEDAHRNFHVELISACEMPLLLQFSHTLHGLSDRYRRIFIAAPHLAVDRVHEHVEIATAAVERRSSEAVGLLKRHIEKTSRQIAKMIPSS